MIVPNGWWVMSLMVIDDQFTPDDERGKWYKVCCAEKSEDLVALYSRELVGPYLDERTPRKRTRFFRADGPLECFKPGHRLSKWYADLPSVSELLLQSLRNEGK